MGPYVMNARRYTKRITVPIDEKLLEAGLTETLRRHEGEEWLRKNRDALEAYNEHIEKHGAFSNAVRSF